MRSMHELEKKIEYVCLAAGPCDEFGPVERDEAALLVKCLLRREGLECDVRCRPRGITIFLRGASSDPGMEEAVNFLCLLMAVSHTLGEKYKVDDDFVIRVDYRAVGCMATTVGKARALSGRTAIPGLTVDELRKAFDFRLHDLPRIGRMRYGGTAGFRA